MPSFVVFIESNTSGTGPLFFAAARKLGHEPIMLAKNPAKYGFLTNLELRVIACDTSSLEHILEICTNLKTEGAIVGVMTSSEYFVETVALLTQRLQLPGPSLPAVRTCRNKAVLRKTIQNAGLEAIRFAEVRDPGEVRIALSQIGLPVVVKPIAGSGSVDVLRCNSEDAAIEHVEHCLCSNSSVGVLIEEYISGPEYSVEVFNGEPIGITQKHLGKEPYFVETGHDFPAAVHTGIESDILRHVRIVCKEIGLSWGPAHVEIKLDAKSHPQIIEINPRLAGGFIPELVRLASGIDLIEETVRLSIGAGRSFKATRERHASIRFIVPAEDGTITKTAGVSRASAMTDVFDVSVYRSCPMEVTLRGDFRDRVGHIITVSNQSENAICAAQKALNLISLSYANGIDELEENKVYECA